METLEELKEKRNKLNKELDIIYDKITKLEQQETLNGLTVGEYYVDTWCDNFRKITSIKHNEIYSMTVDEESIDKSWSTLEDTKGWKKITKEEFDSMLNAVLKDLQDQDLEDKEESNWDITFKAFLNSTNKEK